jgi:rhodanese-related sulfurtransferase
MYKLNTNSTTENTVKEITVFELKKLKDSNANFQLIDVRELWEYNLCNIGGELIPMNTVPSNNHRFKKDGEVIVMCRSGKRSAEIIRFLQKNYGYTNLLNLKGGILEWSERLFRKVCQNIINNRLINLIHGKAKKRKATKIRRSYT